MKNKQKQTLTVAIATSLSVSAVMSPVVVHAIDSDTSVTKQQTGQKEPTVPPKETIELQRPEETPNMMFRSMPAPKTNGDIEINETNFPDEEFRNILKGQSYGNDGILTAAEIATVEKMYLARKNEIKDLKGIEYFTSLTSLDCSNTGITELDVSKNTALGYLDCSKTGIKELDVSKNPALTTLDCSKTGIKELSVSNNTALEGLYCSNTGIKELDVSNNTALGYLYCSYTEIKELSVSNNMALLGLNCANTGITELDVSKNPALQELNCANTGIKELSVSNNTALGYLYCANTGITELDVSKNTALKELNCSNTGITSLDVSNNTNLVKLACIDCSLAWLNVGNNNNLEPDYLIISEESVISLPVNGEPFKITDAFSGIDPAKLSNISGANYDSDTGVFNNYTIGTPIKYTYACGTANTESVSLQVTLNLVEKANSTVKITTEDMNKAYDGNKVTEPMFEKTGSTKDVAITWYQKEAGNSWKQLTSAPVNVGSYKVVVSVEADRNYNNASTEKEFVILKADNAWTDKLSSFTGWTYGETANEPSATAKFGTVEFTYSNEENGTYTSDVPTNAGTWYVKASVAGTTNYTGLEAKKSFIITKADSSVKITTEDMNKAYDGNKVTEPMFEKTGSKKDAVITWYQKESDDNWKGLTSAPTSVGSYKVVVSVEEDENYNRASAEKTFVISQTTNNWKEALSITGWTYGETANEPSATAKFGTVEFTYSNEENGTYTSDVPTNAGTWYVKASVAGTTNYTGLEAKKSFIITKADSSVTITTEDMNKAYDSTKVDDPMFEKTGSKKDAVITWYQKESDDNWKKLTSAPINVGSYKVVVSVEEDENYNRASAEKTFVISQTTNDWKETLSITGWTYGGVANKPTATAKFGTVEFTYSNEENGTYTNDVPTNAGKWYVKASVVGTENYTGLTQIIDFEIAKADNEWTENLSIMGWTYGETASVPNAETKFGDVVYTYSDSEEGTYTGNVPKSVGTYYVKASVVGTENYTGLEAKTPFKIAKADNAWIKELSIDNWTYGETASVPNAETKFGDVVYTYSDSKEGTYTGNVPTSIGTYYVKASVTGTENYTGLESAPVKFEIKLKDGNTVIVVPENLNVTYKDGLKLFDVILPDGWSWVNENTVLSAGEKSYLATFDTTKLESTTDFSVVKGYDKNTHKVTRSINVKVDKADSQVNITISSLDKAYDGDTIKEPDYTTLGSDGKVNIKWQKKSTAAKMEWEDLKSAPSTVGSYRVVVELEENDNYNSASAALEFVISKATNTWNEELSIEGWTYDGKTNDPTAKAQFGDVTFTYSNKENGTYTNEEPQNAGTWYVKASVAETENYTGLEAKKSFIITKADSSVTITTENMNKAYDGNKVNEPMFKKTGSTKDVVIAWYQKETGDSWIQLTSAPVNVGSYKVVVSVEEDENYNRASAEKTIVISKTTNDWKEALLIKGWTYGGVANKPTATAKFGTVEYTYSNEENGTYTSDVPANAGTWYVKASVVETENYTGLEAKKSFEIAKADNAWTKELSITDWMYGETANKPTATAKFGDVIFTYSNEENGTYTNEVPKKAGTWYVKASVVGTENYTGLETKKSFEIDKAEPVYDIPQGLKLKQGDALSTVELPEGFAWVEDTLVFNELGEHKLWAVFTPEDTANYQRKEIEIVVEVVPPMTPINSIPTIQVKDKTFTVNDTFDPLTDVSAFDKEDGDLTDKIKVMENTVDMTKVGTYQVVYQVEDSQKAVATKTITVTVREKAGSQNTDNKPKKEDGAQTGVETGDTTNIFLRGMIAVLSALGVLVIAGKKRRMRKIK